MTLTDIREEVNKLRARYLDAFQLGDSGICTLASAAYLLGLPYQEVRERLVHEYNLRTPLDLLSPMTRDGVEVISSVMTSEFWRRVMGVPRTEVPKGKVPLFPFSDTWPTCISWRKSELEGLTGTAIVWQASTSLLHMTPVVHGWSLDHFGTSAKAPPIIIEPRMAAFGDLEVVYAQPIELR